jgi:hypothetical protein
LLVRHSRQIFENLIFERDAFRIVLLEACLRGVQIRKHLEVLDVADLLCACRRKSRRWSRAILHLREHLLHVSKAKLSGIVLPEEG